MKRVFDVKFNDVSGGIVDCVEVNGRYPLRDPKLLTQEKINAEGFLRVIHNSQVSVLTLAETIVKCDKTDDELAVYSFICGYIVMKQGDSIREELRNSITRCILQTTLSHNNRPNSQIQLLAALTENLERKLAKELKDNPLITKEEIPHVITIIRLITLAGIGVIENE